MTPSLHEPVGDPAITHHLQSLSWIASGLAPAALAFALSMLMHVPILGLTPLSGTEGHRALTAHQMVQSHRWLVPMLFGRPYLSKPPLHYWLIALTETLAGSGNVFVWRLPSAITGSAVCAVVALMATRWFGRTAGFVAGLCAAGMICFWGECQVADIDATNRLMATLAAVCGIELFFGRPERKWLWALGAGAGISALLMTKGPGGVPIIAGIWICAAADMLIRAKRASRMPNVGDNAAPIARETRPEWDSARQAAGLPVLEYHGLPKETLKFPSLVAMPGRPLGQLLSPLFWGPVAMGVVILAAYVLAVYASLTRRHIPLDPTGVIEGGRALYAASTSKMLKALALPPELFAFALPVSLALPLYFAPSVRNAMSAPTRRVATGIVSAVLVSWGVCLASGMVNVRYAYPTLPLLCPLAGAVAVAAAGASRLTADWLRGIVVGSAVALAGAAIGLAYSCGTVPHSRAALLIAIIAAALAIACTANILIRIPQDWRAAWGLALLALLASVPFSMQRNLARTISSGISAAAVVRNITGPGARLEFCAAVFYKPEIFYYAGVNARGILPKDFRPANVPPGTWLFLSTQEYHNWQRNLGPRLTRGRLIAHTDEDDFYLAWYAPAAPATEP